MLARFAALIEPQTRPVVSQTIQQLAELVAARRALIKDRTATTNRAKVLRIALLKRHAGQRLNQIAKQVEDLDRHALALIGADPVLHNRLDILTSIPDIGEPTAIALTPHLPELHQTH